MAKSLSESFLMLCPTLRQGSEISEKEIRALKKRWSRPSNQGTANEEIGVFMEHGPYRICSDQAEKGKDWWINQCFTKKGVVRKTKFVEELPGTVASVVGYMRDGAPYYFEIDEWEPQYNSFGHAFVFPIYTLHCNGVSFEYVARPWQSGGPYIKGY